MQIVEVAPLPVEQNPLVQIHETIIQERKLPENQIDYSSFSIMSNHLKWYVSELRINRPLVYRTSTKFGHQQRDHHRQFSRSFHDLNQVCNQQHRSSDRQQLKMPQEFHQTIYSTSSLEHWNQSASDRRYQSNECIFRSDHWSAAEDDQNLVLNVANDDDDDDDDDLYEDPCGSRM